MARDDHDLLGMLTASQIADNVVAGLVGQFLRRQREVHADRTFRREMRHQLSIFGADCTGGNSGRIAVAGVRQAIVGAPDRADKRGIAVPILTAARCNLQAYDITRQEKARTT